MLHRITQITAILFLVVTVIIGIVNERSKEQLTVHTQYQQVSGNIIEQYKKVYEDRSPTRSVSVIEYDGQKYEIIDNKFYMLYRVGDEAQFSIVNHYNDEGVLVNTETKIIWQD